MVLLLIIILVVVIFLLFWLIPTILLNDFSLPELSLSRLKRVLVIFPHPDDEVFTAGGIVSQLHKKNATITLLTLTKGEKGNDDAHYDEKLKKTRSVEAQNAVNALGFTSFIHLDLGDGELIKKQKEVEDVIKQTIKEKDPQLIITYDQSGLYGHDDHISVSQITTNIIKTKYPKIKLWYVTQSKQVLKMAKLPEHMATDPAFKKKRKLPTYKRIVFLEVFPKIRAIYAHQSQLYSFKKTLPKGVPIWFFGLTQIVEYIYKEN